MQHSARFGIALGVLAYALFSVHDAAIKWLVALLPVWQVLFFRSLTIVTGCLAWGGRDLLVRALTTPLRGPLLVRGAITLVAWLLYYTASRHLPLAQLLTLYFSAPVITTIMAAPLLGEKVTTARWVAVGMGFVGVLVAADPFGLRLEWPALLVFTAAALWGYGIILMRQIARQESTLLQMLFSNSFFLAGTGMLCLYAWVPPTPAQIGLLVAIGVVGGLGQFALFEAARWAPASAIAPVEYSALVWAFLLGYAVWGDVPPVAVFAGAGLILAAGLFLVVAERRGA